MTSQRAARRRDLRAAPIAAAAWAVAAWATAAPEVAALLAVGCAGLTIAALLAAAAARPRRRRDLRTALALAGVALAGAGAAAAHVAAAAPARAALSAIEVDGGRSIAYTLTVSGKVEPSATGIRFDAITSRASWGDEVREISAPVVVRSSVAVADAPAGLDVGATLRVRGTAFRAEAGERAVLVIDAAELEVLRPPDSVLAVAARLRAGLRAATVDLPPPGAGLIAGLAVGDTAAVTADLDTAMKQASLSHLTAVSGANCALVVAIAFGAAAWCGARRVVRVAAGLAALTGFVVLVTPEPSVVRAAVMAAIAMLGVLLGRIGAGVSLLTVAVAGILILDPWLCTSLGFALSAAATGALLLLAGPLGVGLGRWMPGPLAVAVSVPLAAQLACGPLLILVQPTVSAQGVLANMIAAPAAPVGTVVGLAACLAAGIPVLGAGLAGLAWLPAAWIAGTAHVFAPVGVLPWLDGLVGAASLALIGAALAALVVVTPRPVRLAAGAVVAVAAGIVLGLGPLRTGVQRMEVPTGWSVAACDVGQGDAVLLRSAGHVMLVDTGPEPEPLADCLGLLGVSHIDVLVLTHFDLDHRGGIDAVTGGVGLLVHSPPGGADDERTLARQRTAGAVTRQVSAGQSGRLGDARWRVLWPRGAAAPPGNDASVVVEISGGGVPATLLLGDLSAQPQAALARSLHGHYTVVKVAHHGSADQDFALYRQARPAVALISVGENDYGHPRAEIIDVLRAGGARVLRTDEGGTIALAPDDTGIRIWRADP